MMRGHLVDTVSTTSAAFTSAGRALRAGVDELAVCGGITAVVAGVALISVPVACMTGGAALTALGVGRIAFQSRSGK